VNPIPNTFKVSSVAWDIFATLTFRRVSPGSSWALASGLNWLEEVRIRTKLSPRDFFWLLRSEGGEKFGRVHLHVLLRIPPVYRSLFLLRGGAIPWAHRVWGRGLTTFRRVEGFSDPCCAYTIKPDTSGADEYELKKTGVSSVCIPSEALKRRMLLQKWAGGADQKHGDESLLRPLAEISSVA